MFLSWTRILFFFLYFRTSSPNTSAAIMSVHKDADCYNMNHKYRGKCVIFNHEQFDTGFDKREGSSTDAVRLENSFGKLGFEVHVHNDLNHVEVMTEIDNREQRQIKFKRA